MMKKIIKYSLFLIAVFTWVVTAGFAHAYDLSAYLPVQDGSAMPYEQMIDGNAARSVTVFTGPRTMVNGTTYTNTGTTTANSGDLKQSQYVTWGVGGLELHQQVEGQGCC